MGGLCLVGLNGVVGFYLSGVSCVYLCFRLSVLNDGGCRFANTIEDI